MCRGNVIILAFLPNRPPLVVILTINNCGRYTFLMEMPQNFFTGKLLLRTNLFLHFNY